MNTFRNSTCARIMRRTGSARDPRYLERGCVLSLAQSVPPSEICRRCFWVGPKQGLTLADLSAPPSLILVLRAPNLVASPLLSDFWLLSSVFFFTSRRQFFFNSRYLGLDLLIQVTMISDHTASAGRDAWVGNNTCIR